jgi:putative FmdB family regulatory protein
MPVFDWGCNACRHEWEIVFRMSEEQVARCPECDSRDTRKVWNRACAVRLPDIRWETENDGRGRYISQLAKHQDDQSAYCRSRQEAITKAKDAGFTVTDA